MGFLNRMQGDKKDRLCPWLLLPVHKLQGWKFAYFLFCSKDLKTHSVSSFLLSNLTKSPGSVCNSFKFWLLCWKAQLISKTQVDWQSRQEWRQSLWNFWKSCLIFFLGCLSYFLPSNILHTEHKLRETSCACILQLNSSSQEQLKNKRLIWMMNSIDLFHNPNIIRIKMLCYTLLKSPWPKFGRKHQGKFSSHVSCSSKEFLLWPKRLWPMMHMTRSCSFNNIITKSTTIMRKTDKTGGTDFWRKNGKTENKYLQTHVISKVD